MRDNMHNIIIFGAGMDGKRLLSQLEMENIAYFVDNDPQKQNTDIKGITVKNPDILKSVVDKMNYDIVISTQQYAEAIKKQLKEIGWQNYFLSYEYLIKCMFEQCYSQKRVILMNTHTGTNIGDHFITNAEILFFQKYLPEHGIVEISADLITRGLLYIRQYIKKDDIIAITGGGFLGSLWLEGGEENVRAIIQSFPQNKIVILPQTLFFENNTNGKYQKELSVSIYNKHSNLYICLRDRNSMKTAREIFGKHIKLYYFPDMVTIMNCCNIISDRKDIAFCFREDKESVLDQNQIKKIFINDFSNMVNRISMHEMAPLNAGEREKILYDKIQEIKSYKLVVTDRLHCMILCAITGTPCIAMDNLSKKVSGVYQWIKDNPYIYMVHDMEELNHVLKGIDLSRTFFYSSRDLEKYFKQLSVLFVNNI